MDEVISQDRFQSYIGNHCVLCENLEYQKSNYDNLCYQHKRKLLWG